MAASRVQGCGASGGARINPTVRGMVVEATCRRRRRTERGHHGSGATMLAAFICLSFCAIGAGAFIRPPPSTIFPPPPAPGSTIEGYFPSFQGASSAFRLSATAKSFLGQTVGAVPSYLAEKAFDRMDELYLKRSLFLPPPSDPDPAKADALVVIFPGIAMAPTQYTEVARAIQQEALSTYNQSLYVVVAKFFNNLGYLPKEPERRLTSIIADLEKQGMPRGKPVGIIGHSGGAFLAYDVALTKSQAFVHMGSTLNSKGVLPWKPRSLIEYPKPLLTLLGEMDGYIRFTGGALEYDVVEKQRAKQGFQALELDKPVVVLPGISHEQFADGTQTKVAKMSGRRDLAPYASLRDAWQGTARIVAAFFALHLSSPGSSSSGSGSSGTAVETLREAHRVTGKIVEPFLKELEPESEEAFVRFVQRQVAGLSDLDLSTTITTVTYTSQQEFIYSKPTIASNSEGDNIIVQVQVFRDTQDPIKTGFTKQVAPGLWLKMKRQEAVAQALGREPSKASATAQDLNTRTLEWALDMISPEARERYEKYGRKLTFLPDDEITSERGGGPGWVGAPLQVLVDKSGDFRTATLQSPVLYTPLDTLPRFAGMCYMKVLSRAQALEWLLHDAFIPMP